jgi:Flp pilus assembly pilin Flp
MKQLITKFIADEQGQDIIEYALLGSFVAFGAYAGATTLGTAYANWLSDVGGKVDSAAGKIAPGL